MSRIRSIKPEFWASEQIIGCSPTARLLFIGIWCFADDAGRHPLSPRTLKAEVFPADDLTAEDVRRMLDELSANGLIEFYRAENKDYLAVTGWRHQRIDRPQPAKHPPPSSNARRAFVEHSTTDLRDQTILGSESKKLPLSAARALPPRATEIAPSPAAASPAPAESRAALQQISVPAPARPQRPEGWSKALAERLLAEGGLADEAASAPGLLDVSPIVRLLDEGFDLEGEILPVIRSRIARGGAKPRSWAYFVEAVREARSVAMNGKARGAATVALGVDGLPNKAPIGPDETWRQRIAMLRAGRPWSVVAWGDRDEALETCPSWARTEILTLAEAEREAAVIAEGRPAA